MLPLESAYQHQAIERWWTKLCTRIESINKNGKRVVLVAMSRKMPRFFKWIKNVFLKEHGDGLCSFEVVEGCELITEHAIPFVIASAADDNFEFIVVDDSIIYGDTIRSAVELIFAFSKKVPYISSIFVSKRFGTSLNANLDDIKDCVPLEDSELKDALRYVAARNLELALPIDVEYPILYFKKDSTCFQQQKIFLEESYIDNIKTLDGKSYRVTYHDNLENFSVGLNSYSIIGGQKLDEDYNNDFAKVRFFESLREEQIKVVAYAPNVLSQSSINKEELFESPIYRSIWKEILNHRMTLSYDPESVLVAERVSECLNRSLAVFANYLFSLSTFIRTWGESFLEKSDVYFDEKDLYLLVGEQCTKRIMEKLYTILKNKEVSPSKRRRMVLPAFICPKKFERVYETRRIMSLLGNQSNPENMAKAVFTLQYFSDGITSEFCRSSVSRNVKIRFGETFDSLISLYSMFGIDEKKKESVETSINKWIDTYIDEGAIVPRYECVTDTQGVPFWKRYFLAGAVPL